MAKHYKSNKHNPIVFHLEKQNLSKIDLCRLLNVSRITMQGYIDNPCNMTVKQVLLLSGILKIDYLRLIMLLVSNKATVNKSHERQLSSLLLSEDRE